MYQKLEIDFEIPYLLENSINEFLVDLNEHGGRLADCFEEDIIVAAGSMIPMMMPTNCDSRTIKEKRQMGYNYLSAC